MLHVARSSRVQVPQSSLRACIQALPAWHVCGEDALTRNEDKAHNDLQFTSLPCFANKNKLETHPLPVRRSTSQSSELNISIEDSHSVPPSHTNPLLAASSWPPSRFLVAISSPSSTFVWNWSKSPQLNKENKMKCPKWPHHVRSGEICFPHGHIPEMCYPNTGGWPMPRRGWTPYTTRSTTMNQHNELYNSKSRLVTTSIK